MMYSIITIYPPAPQLGPDRLGWKSDKKGLFTVNFAYNLLVGSVTTGGSFSWSSVWRLSLPQRICSFFFLLALRGGLLTNVERCRRHLCVDVICTRCRQSPEDLLHVLRDCACTRPLWLRVVPHDSMQFIFVPDYVKRDGLIEECKILLEQVKLAKVNVDGVVNHLTNAAAIGGVCRSDSGLQYAWRQGYCRVVIESDYQEAVCCVTNGNMLRMDNGLVVIKDWLLCQWEVQVRYVSRQYNAVADWLAKALRDHTVSTMFFKEPPDGICSLLEFDLQNRDVDERRYVASMTIESDLDFP
ncbi:hypothetical protein V6N11_079208 [Hibiscus sabdariffa]|uniref:Uncharacterized protein n=1 Tax=Hibiscus sabdariffa TaxID=183260 RepID=A0ABR2RUQ8_9ROSI